MRSPSAHPRADIAATATYNSVQGVVENMADSFKQQWHGKMAAQTPVSVQCLPLRDILPATGVTSIDYFSLDVEGAELSVLQGFPFEHVAIDVIMVELDGRNVTKDEAVRELLGQHGLDFVFRAFNSDWFRRRRQ